jgi:hypothetical protein
MSYTTEETVLIMSVFLLSIVVGVVVGFVNERKRKKDVTDD